MLLYYVDTLLRYVDMLLYYVDIYFRDVKTSLCYVVTSFLFVMCKHHIIILNFSMTKITRVALTLNARGEMAYSHSPWHGAIQDVRLRTLYSKFVEKRERSNNCKGHSDFVTELCNEPIQGSGNMFYIKSKIVGH